MHCRAVSSPPTPTYPKPTHVHTVPCSVVEVLQNASPFSPPNRRGHRFSPFTKAYPLILVPLLFSSCHSCLANLKPCIVVKHLDRECAICPLRACTECHRRAIGVSGQFFLTLHVISCLLILRIKPLNQFSQCITGSSGIWISFISGRLCLFRSCLRSGKHVINWWGHHFYW